MHGHKSIETFFRYNKIKTYDIQLPPDMISIDYDTKAMRDSLIAHLNELMLKGKLVIDMFFHAPVVNMKIK